MPIFCQSLTHRCTQEKAPTTSNLFNAMKSLIGGANIIIEEIEYPASALALLCLSNCANGTFFLESALSDSRLSRWSFFGADPFLRFKSKGHNITIVQNSIIIRQEHGNPFFVLKSLLERYRINREDAHPPFLGGAAGFFGYDLCQILEKLPSIAKDDIDFPDCSLNFYDVVVALDHGEQRAFISSCGWPEAEDERRLPYAQTRLDEMKERLALLATSNLPAIELINSAVESRRNFTRAQYLSAIRCAKEYIAAGDIYQVNLSQRFSYPFGGNPLELYIRLREINPAPFAGLILEDDWALVGASPERFLQVRGDWVETRPIKGTRRRGRTPEADARLAQELLISEKDRAENVMIVDLERNDLGKVCKYGSVSTTELWALERYPTVFHLVSTVEGRLLEGNSSLDLLRACFPGGSITGAPKVRAMEIIEELEPTKRGPYTGAMGYICFSGDMDLNIIIRTVALKDGWAHYQVGGGIVADSDPEAEYQETLDKGLALQQALAGDGESR